MGSRRPISAILAVFGGLEIGLRCARYAGWVCIRCIYDLRRPPGYSLSPQKSVKRLFEATYLVTPDFEFGMTQAFLGQMDGRSRSGMARKP